MIAGCVALGGVEGVEWGALEGEVWKQEWEEGWREGDKGRREREQEDVGNGHCKRVARDFCEN